MDDPKDIFKKLIELMGFEDFSVDYDAESSRLAIIISEDSESFRKQLPVFVTNLNHLSRLIAKRINSDLSFFVDINYYHKERENLIVELARGAARKVVATKKEVALPIMNAYERRIIHLELASRPDLKTESVGEGKNRYVVIRPIE